MHDCNAGQSYCRAPVSPQHPVARHLPHRTFTAMTRHREREREARAPRAGENDMASGTSPEQPALCPFAGDLLRATLALGTCQVKMRYQSPAPRLKCLEIGRKSPSLHEPGRPRRKPANVGIRPPSLMHIRARIEACRAISVLSDPLKAVSSCAARSPRQGRSRPTEFLPVHRPRRAPDHA
jgi:hypothetical protein